MIDYGLLISLILAFGLPSLVVMRWQLTTFDDSTGFADATLGPALAGAAVGRLTALALDDPSSIGSISDMIIIRSGVEFWPGVVAAIAVVAWGARRAGVQPMRRLGELAPAAMIGYAAYELGCIFRDGCFGPLSAIGLRPPGLTATMIPIGVFMAAAVALAAVALRRLSLRDVAQTTIVFAGLAVVALVRSVGSIWLPHVGDGLTRQHVTSIVVAAVAVGFVGASVVRQASRAESEPSLSP